MKKWKSGFVTAAVLMGIVLVVNFRTVGYALDNESTAELYQQYYNLQRKRDALDNRRETLKTTAWNQINTAKWALKDDPTNTSLHRQLIIAQNAWSDADDDWLSDIGPIDGNKDAIRNLLQLRGEPPPH